MLITNLFNNNEQLYFQSAVVIAQLDVQECATNANAFPLKTILLTTQEHGT